MRGIYIHPEPFPDRRLPDKVQLRTEPPSGTGLEIELPARIRLRIRPHIHIVGLEVIRALVRILKNGIVELQIELGQAVRHCHLHGRLAYLHQFSLILAGYRDCRIEILGRQASAEGGEGQNRDSMLYFHFHNHLIIPPLWTVFRVSS